MVLLPPTLSVDASSRNRELSDKLDDDISRVRAEIESLTKRKHLLVSSLLSSTKVQDRLSARAVSQPDSLPLDLTPLRSQAQYTETNIHRLAFGVTSFPYTDPNPDTSTRPLLGIRFDIPSRNGKFEKAPYYIFLKSCNEDGADAIVQRRASSDHILQIQHHTIPALVPLQDYGTRYLPQTVAEVSEQVQRTDEGYFSPAEDAENDDGTDESIRSGDRNPHKDNPTQNLHALVAAVRRDLTSWQLRNDAISLLAEQLGLSILVGDEKDNASGMYSLQSLQATALDARFVRLVWRDGTVGRLRLADDGYVNRAVVIGTEGNATQPNRLKAIERVLNIGKSGRRVHISDLIQRLQEAEKRMNKLAQQRTATDGDDNNEDSMQVDAEE